MVDRLVNDTGSQIRYAGESQDLYAHMACDNRLGHCAHPYSVGPKRPQQANLGRRLIAGPTQRCIDAASELESHLCGLFDCYLLKVAVIDLAHVRKPWPETGIVRTDQRVLPHQVQ